MAQQYVTDSGAVLTVPGAYTQYSVQNNPSGLATTGVIAILGEASSGPAFGEESDLDSNRFGPDQVAEAQAKYGSGPLIDALRLAVSPSNDPRLPGSPQSFLLVKTNTGAQASVAILDVLSAAYGTLRARSAGANGNATYVQVVQNSAEALPTTGAFTWIPPVGALAVALRVDGAAAVTSSMSADVQPDDAVIALAALAGVDATGGDEIVVQPAGGTIAVTVVAGDQVSFVSSAGWVDAPAAGETVVIPTGSVIAGGAGQNVGAYIVISATATAIIATKLSDAGRAGAVAGVITAPLTVGALSVVADDILGYERVVVSSTAGAMIPGIGKSLEFADNGGADSLARVAWTSAEAAAPWVSTAASPQVIVAGTEYSVDLVAAQPLNGISDSLDPVGGEIALRVGYDGTTATISITASGLSTTVAGGSGVGLAIDFAQFATIQAVANYINSQTGYVASVGSGTLGNLPSTALDIVATQGICSQHGAPVGRVKVDAFRFFQLVSTSASLVEMLNSSGALARANVGLPIAMAAPQYLSGGTRGGTTDANMAAAYAAMENTFCNFVAPAFSRDASIDIANGVTDPSSTYTIAAINAGASTHVIKMSGIKFRRNRQALIAFDSSFALQREAASNVNNPRTAMAFQTCRQVGGNGSIQEFGSWGSAVVAAGMQAAAFSRGIVMKTANVTAIGHSDGTFNAKSMSDQETALNSGLLPMKPLPTGGFAWTSDQTTYVRDENFVFNSIQAIYVADVMSVTAAERMELAFIGQSLRDISAKGIQSYWARLASDFLRLGLIAPSDGAPLGYKDVVVKITGPAARISVKVYLATLLYFIDLNFTIAAVEQSN